MAPLTDELRREVRVAFSPRAQPIWFRVLKWMVFGGVTAYFWGTPQLWIWITAALALGISAHLLWRWKTDRWTRPWHGWDDTAAAARIEADDHSDWKYETGWKPRD